MIIRCLISITALLLLTACSTTHDCLSSSIAGTIVFEGFDSAALERVVISRYDGYNKKTDSTIYLLSADSTDLQYDTSGGGHFVIWPYSVRMVPGDDWEVKVSNAGKTYRIAGLTRTHGSVKQSFMGNDEVCYDLVTGYYVNATYASTGATEKDINYGQFQPITLHP